MAVDLQSVAHHHFWAESIKATPELEAVIKAVTSGNLIGSAANNVLNLVLGQFSGKAEVPYWVKGAINMKGGPLPSLPASGTLTIVVTLTTAELSIYDTSKLLIYTWSGSGYESGLAGTWQGTWVKLD